MRTVFRYIGKYACVAAIAGLAGCSLFASKPPTDAPVPLVEFKATQKIRTLWTVSVGKSENYEFSPVQADDSIYAAAADGTVARINTVSGKPVWRVNAGVKLTAGVGSDGLTVAVAGEKGVVLAYDNTGKLLWKAQATSEILSAPAVGSGLVVVRSLDNHIFAFDAATGERRWMAERTLPTLTLRNAPGIVIDAQTAYVAMPGGRLSALMLSNGGPRWEIPVGDPRGTTELERVSDVSGRPAIVGSDICAVAFQGRIGCFDIGSGSVHWLKQFSSAVGLGADEHNVYAADERGGVTEFVRETGAGMWRNDKLGYRQLTTPVALGDVVAVGDYQGFVHFLSRDTGDFVARVATDGSAITAAPIVAASSVIFQTKAGSLVALAAE
ncbi:MAG: bamB [Herbaspirillum sp.]|jgi:outer membrane protein assembly factor BamB|nr:bamB [Herbaspirillum sp.]